MADAILPLLCASKCFTHANFWRILAVAKNRQNSTHFTHANFGEFRRILAVAKNLQNSPHFTHLRIFGEFWRILAVAKNRQNSPHFTNANFSEFFRILANFGGRKKSINSPDPDISDAEMSGSVLRTCAVLILSRTFAGSGELFSRRSACGPQPPAARHHGRAPLLRHHDGHPAHVRHVDLRTRVLRIRRNQDANSPHPKNNPPGPEHRTAQPVSVALVTVHKIAKYRGCTNVRIRTCDSATFVRVQVLIRLIHQIW